MHIPTIFPEDLSSFHATHFSLIARSHFSEHFLGPVEGGNEEYQEDDDDDRLGYYEDGTKRTLTDEQIAMFRHSEIQTILRKRRYTKEANWEEESSSVGRESASFIDDSPAASGLEEDVEDGGLGGENDIKAPKTNHPPLHNGRRLSKKVRKSQKSNQKSLYKQHVKPDLRKRTWDKVETGLGSLDYDEAEGGGSTALPQPSQRRRVTYDED